MTNYDNLPNKCHSQMSDELWTRGQNDNLSDGRRGHEIISTIGKADRVALPLCRLYAQKELFIFTYRLTLLICKSVPVSTCLLDIARV